MMSNWFGPGKPAKANSEENFTEERHRMVQEQLAPPDRGITDQRVLAAMDRVPRHEFVPQELRGYAYADGALGIGYGQTISQPFVVAFMTQQLGLKPTDRVLEIGTGCGYQTAILAELAAEVYTIEIIEPLAQRAVTDLKRLGYTNIQVRAGDGYRGWPEAAPFDAVMVTCAAQKVPQELLDQLTFGGRMIIPVGKTHSQELVFLRELGGKLERRAVLPVRFVPMTRGGNG